MRRHAADHVAQAAFTVPVHAGRLALGTWQGLYLWEHRSDAHQRKVTVTVIGGG